MQKLNVKLEQKFGDGGGYVCDGDTVNAYVNGIRFEARIERDDISDRPDERDDGFWPSKDPNAAGYVDPAKYKSAMARAKQVMAAWENDEWWYVGVVISAHVGEVCLDNHLGSLWGIECNYPPKPGSRLGKNKLDNSYLNEIAVELIEENFESALELAKNLRSMLDSLED